MQASQAPGRRPVLALAAAVLLLYAYPVWQPALWTDDFQILARSATWAGAWENLWAPHNEHVMPLGRLSTWLLLRLAGGQSAWPRAAALHGVAALAAGLGLVYLFVRRELGHPFYGLAAAILFGVSAVYQQAVLWFAAGFSVLTLDTLLLALLAAQAWRQSGRGRALVWCAGWCGLAPAWFAGGVLAGPWCALYLLAVPARRSWAAAAAPLLGTALFLAVSLPRTAEQVLHSGHYQGQTAVQAFDIQTGLLYSVRSLADNLLLGSLGVSLGFFPKGVHLPLAAEVVLVAAFAAALVWWWRPVSPRRLLVLGLGLIGLTYLLTYGARALWSYHGDLMNRPGWGRYHLLPQLGLVLLICGGLPGRQGRWFTLDPAGALSGRQAWALAALSGVLLLTQFPRAVLGMSRPPPGQQAVLRRVEQVDEQCRQHGISAASARAALGHLKVPGSHDWEDGWQLLRGSAEPRPRSAEEVREILLVFESPSAPQGNATTR